MSIKKITKRVVDTVSPSATAAFIWDDEIPGFGLKVLPSGKKTYILQFRLPGVGRRGTTKRLHLGEHGVLTPDEARKLARRELGKVAFGQNPAADKAARGQEQTVAELSVPYLEEVDARRKKKVAVEYRRLWTKHILPALGSKPVSGVTSADVRKLHRSLADTPYVANRVVARLSSFYTYAIREGIVPSKENPTDGVEPYTEEARERFLTKAEFGRLGAALAQAETMGLPPAPETRRKPKEEKNQKHRPKSADRPFPANPFAVAAIRLLALTGCRENEILSLRWDAVDLERGYLRLVGTKTGKSVRPLGQSAAAILAGLSRIKGNPHVLPGLKPGDHLREIKRLWYAVRHVAKLENLRLHDLRHSFAAVPAASGESLLVVRSLLGHKNVATTERYAHLGADPVRRAADTTSRDIAAWLDSSAVAISGETSKRN